MHGVDGRGLVGLGRYPPTQDAQPLVQHAGGVHRSGEDRLAHRVGLRHVSAAAAVRNVRRPALHPQHVEHLQKR